MHFQEEIADLFFFKKKRLETKRVIIITNHVFKIETRTNYILAVHTEQTTCSNKPRSYSTYNKKPHTYINKPLIYSDKPDNYIHTYSNKPHTVNIVTAHF